MTRVPIEVAPTAHYHMGGIAANDRMETRVAGLFAAGEAVGGANGANRLSGNAITEALVFGERAGFLPPRPPKPLMWTGHRHTFSGLGADSPSSGNTRIKAWGPQPCRTASRT